MKSPRGSGRSSYAVGGLCVCVVGGLVVVDVVPSVELLVVVDLVVVVVVGAGVALSAGQEPSAGPASRHESQASTDVFHGVTAQQVQQQLPAVAMTTPSTAECHGYV